ncbi:MAG: helix-turn-helix transcriptional regulator [Clostridia bacterium]|nr:helix-turn-helix transcriptional regulator [Clostridia bacterium]
MEEFAKFIKTDEIKFKHAKGMRDIIGNEIHSYHEIFFFMGEDAEFISEHGHQKLLPNTTVIIPKETFHCFTVPGDNSLYQRCVFNFDCVSELDELIKSNLNEISLIQNERLTQYFKELTYLVESDYTEEEKKILLKSVFAQILVHVKKQAPISISPNVSSITKRALAFIHDNLSSSLTAESIAKAIFVSPSYLAHVFKKDLRIPIHKYVLERRLITADKMIKNRTLPTRACIECGFTDYSGFYLQYKKMFGVPPSAVKPKQ